MATAAREIFDSCASPQHRPVVAEIDATGEVPVAVCEGDGIGPEIMRATLRILAEAGARISPRPVELGAQVWREGHTAGIRPQDWARLRGTRAILKAPVSTPSGSGVKSLNVTLRKSLGLYANVRPCVSYSPFVPTRHPGMDVVVVRENEEDLYAGIEHRQTDQVVQCLKLITRPGCERIVRYAFEYARHHGRRRVTCMVKDNIMKMSDGLFYEVFEQVGAEYPEIERERLIIDIGAARLATRPERFDVIVTPNLYGDILSDVAAEVAGGIGLAGSANIGPDAAMFEAVHGSAPDIAGQGIANPSGLLLSAVMLLVHVRQPRVAELVHNAWLRALESGIHTADLAGPHTRARVGTEAFADAVIERLGETPRHLAPVRYSSDSAPRIAAEPVAMQRPAARKSVVGVDVFVDRAGASPQFLGELLRSLETGSLKLQLVTNRGAKVWPDGLPETYCTDHWRCRFMADGTAGTVDHAGILELLTRLTRSGVDVIKTENLCTFDGVPGFTLGQGQ